MAVISKEDFTYLTTEGVNTIFAKHFSRAIKEGQWQLIATRVSSRKSEEKYAWLGESPWPSPWTDERQIKATNPEQNYVLTNAKYEATIGIEREAFDDELYGQISVRIQQLATNMARWFDEQVFSTLVNGETKECYDGQYFFDTDHTDPGATYTTSQSNLGSSELTVANLKSTITAMRKFKDGNGKPAGITPTHLVVPPDLEFTAIEILKSQYYPSATNMGTSTTTDYVAVNKVNPVNGALGLIVSPYITDSDSWYVVDLSKAVKPLILQEREPVEFKMLTSDDNAFLRDQYLAGVRWRGAFGYSDWRLAYAQTP